MGRLFVTALYVWFVGAALAGLLEDGQAAYGRGDFATALRLLLPLAEQGNASAQYSLGVMHDDGLGVPPDPEAAARWFRDAAEQGHSEAQLRLSEMYFTGIGVPVDYAESGRWIRMAAEQGHADAQYGLGLMYALNLDGFPHDPAEAVRWVRMAAEQRHARALCKLARMYRDGDGVEQNFAVAYVWAYLCASQGCDHCDANWLRDNIAARLTPAAIIEAQRVAREWDAAHSPQR